MGSLTHWICFLFFKRTDVLGPCLSVVFGRLVRVGSLPVCCRQANVTPIPKGPTSSSVTNYRPIFITSVLSKVFARVRRVSLESFVCQTTYRSSDFSLCIDKEARNC